MWLAFNRLQGDRHLGYGAAGPIPFLAIDAYARRHGIDDPDEFDRFAELLARMDGAMRKLERGRAERDAKNQKTKR